MPIPSEITGCMIQTETAELIVRSTPDGLFLSVDPGWKDAALVRLNEDTLAALIWALHEFAPPPDETVDF